MNDFDTEIQALNAAIIEYRVNAGLTPNPIFSFCVVLSLFIILAIFSRSGGLKTLFVFLGIFISYFALYFQLLLFDKNEKKLMETIQLLLDQLTTKFQSTGLMWYMKTEALYWTGDNKPQLTIKRTLVIRHGSSFSYIDCKVPWWVNRYEVDTLGLQGCLVFYSMRYVPCIMSIGEGWTIFRVEIEEQVGTMGAGGSGGGVDG